MPYDFLNEKPPKRLSLKVAIAASGKSQRDIATAIGKHEVILSQIIGGRITPTKFECYKIAEQLQAHPRSLFEELYDWRNWPGYAAKFGIKYEYPMKRGR